MDTPVSEELRCVALSGFEIDREVGPDLDLVSLAKQGIDIEKRMLLLNEPIKAIGTYSVPIRVYKGVKPEITVEKPADAGKYYIRTSALDTEGYEGVFSEPQTFEVKGNYLYLPAGLMVLIILAVILL